jgi:hypothetical protein
MEYDVYKVKDEFIGAWSMNICRFEELTFDRMTN